jgi:mycoredoxin-dependent peroxiredoxin
VIRRASSEPAGGPGRGVEVGDLAPDFSLRGPAGQPVTLSEYRGSNVLLVFFPLAFSPACSSQLPDIERASRQPEHTDVVVLGISVDSHWTNQEFARRLGLSFPLLSDFDRRTSAEYGVLEAERGHSGRALFAIDRRGRVVYKEVSTAPPTELRGIPSHQRAIEALRAAG